MKPQEPRDEVDRIMRATVEEIFIRILGDMAPTLTPESRPTFLIPIEVEKGCAMSTTAVLGDIPVAVLYCKEGCGNYHFRVYREPRNPDADMPIIDLWLNKPLGAEINEKLREIGNLYNKPRAWSSPLSF